MNGIEEKKEKFKGRVKKAIEKRNNALDGDGIMCLSLTVQQEEQWRTEVKFLEDIIKTFDEIFKE